MSTKIGATFACVMALSAVTIPLCAQVTSVNGGVDFAPLSAPFQNPMGLAASPTRLLMTTAGCSKSGRIAIRASVNPVPYATMPPHPVLGAPPLDCESMMATSPGLHWASPRRYGVHHAGQSHYSLPPASSTLALVATLPVSSLGATGATFRSMCTPISRLTPRGHSTAWSFGRHAEMIVSISQGTSPSSSSPFTTTVWLVDSTGASSLLATASFAQNGGTAVVPPVMGEH